MSEGSADPTPLSLLRQLQEPAGHPSEQAWRRFVNLYTPLLFQWARRVGARDQEIPDLVQEVFVVLAGELRSFQHGPGRRFRGWLWTVLLNKWRDHARRRAAVPTVEAEAALATVSLEDPVAEFTEEEYRTYLIGRVLEIMRVELPDREWQACRDYILRGRSVAEVARELGLSVNQVYLAKSRLLRRLREELEGLLD
jgi:RNA polymerase sigma-70 factor (ECF subfamily)